MSPISKDDIAAIGTAAGMAAAKAITDSQPPHKVILDSQGNDPAQSKRPWWRAHVPAWITGSLLGGILGVGIAWGGMTAANAEQDKAIVKVEKDVKAVEDLARAVELDSASLKAGNAEQHAALADKVSAVKEDVAEVKTDVADVKKDVKDLARKLDQVLTAVKKL